MFNLKNNERVAMTRRYPDLRPKVLKRDSEITMRLIHAWDSKNDEMEVLSIFKKEHRNLSDERYWELLRTVWVICGSVELVPMFRPLFTANRRSKHYFSTPEESAYLRSLPEILPVYRACNDAQDGGISWTLSEQYAEWYKAAYCKQAVISKAVNRTSIFAIIQRNLEEEAIIL